MIIEEKIKSKLLNWNDKEPIYKQFEKKCAALTRISGVIINPNDYQLQYELHSSSLDTYTDYQTELYGMLYEKYPNLTFGMSGRLKSQFSHYEKVVRKFVELFERDEFKTAEILDDYAMKVFILSVNYDVDKISVDTEGIYIDSGTDEFRICDNDCFEFLYEGKELNVPVEEGQTNVWIDCNIPYISTTITKSDISNEKITLPLKDAVKYRRSNKEDLVDYCYDMQKDIESFYNSRGFTTMKRKDYISRPKPSGYASRQCSFYSEEQGLGLECQIRTYDMEKFNTYERKLTYKPDEKKISSNSLSKVSRFALTTKFGDGYQTYTMTDAECFEYIFDMPLKEYRKLMKPTIAFKEDKKQDLEDEKIEGESR